VANEIEIVVTTRYEPGQGLASAAQDARSQAQSIAADVERIFDRSADSVARSFSDVGSRINRELDSIRSEEVDVKVQVDDSEVRTAAGDIRDLDSIPPPTIEIDADAKPAVDSIKDTLGNIDVGNAGDSIVNQLGSKLGPGGPLSAVALGLGALFADDIAEGLTRGFTAAQRNIDVQIQTGFGPGRSRLIGEAAGDAYGAGFGESASTALDAAIILERKLGDIDPSFNLEEASRWALTLSEHLGVDVPTAAELAGRMIQQGLADNTEHAFDIMIDAAQRYGHQTDEVLDATREFGGVFEKLGIEGPAAVRLIGDTYEQGLTSQVERAAEAMEELNTRITDGDSREAIESLGLSFENLQQRISQGGPEAASAVRDIATALLEEEDAAIKAEAANRIFGTAFETTGQIDAFTAAVLAAADAQVEVGGTADKVADQVEAMTTQWEIAQRRVSEVATVVGQGAAREFNRYTDALIATVDAGKSVVSWLGDLTDGQDDATAATRVLDGAFDGFVDTFDAVPSVLQDGARATDDIADAADEATRAWDDLAAASANALAEVNKWADNSGTNALIGLFDATTDLERSFGETDAAAFDLAKGFDLTTEAGVRGQAMVNAYEQDLQTLISAYASQDVSAKQLSDSLAVNEQRFREAAAAAGFEKEQVDALATSLFGVTREWVAEVNAEGNVWAQVDAASLALDRINGKTSVTYVNLVETVTRYVNNIANWFGRSSGGSTGGSSGSSRVAAAPSAFYAAGTSGIVAAQTGGGGQFFPTLVNEAGPEAARLPSGDIVGLPTGSSVLTAPDTERLFGQAPSAPAIEVNITVLGSMVALDDVREFMRDEVFTGGLDGLGGIR